MRIFPFLLLCAFAVHIFAAYPATARVPEAQKKGLSSSSVKARVLAISALSKLKDDEARVLLQEVVLHDADATVRAAALQALGKRNDVAAIDAVVAAGNDDDVFVKETAAKVLTSLRALQTSVEVGEAVDHSDASVVGLMQRLRSRVLSTLRTTLGPWFVVSETPQSRGYALLLGVRSVAVHNETSPATVDVRCEATVVENPGQILRLVLASTASVGMAGKISEKMKGEFATDAVDACGPALAKDFADYVVMRVPKKR